MKTEINGNLQKTDLTRRGFVTGLAATGAGALALGLVGCGDDGKPDAGAASSGDVKPDTINWEMETDFVICGLGAAGIGAAIEADALGINCIAFEKQPEDTAGGDLRCSYGGLFFSTTSTQSLIENQMSYAGGGHLSNEFLEQLSVDCDDLVDWLDEYDIEWGSQSESLWVPVGNGPTIYDTLIMKLADTNVETHYGTPVKRLIQDPETNETIGVYVEKDGAEIAVKARLGVLLATGGYTADKDLTEKLSMPEVEYFPTGSPYCTGDGIRMGGEVGAQMSHFWRGLEYCNMVSKAASEANDGKGVYVATEAALAQPSRIFVNSEGKRFFNEAQSLTHWKNDTPAPVSYVRTSGAWATATESKGFVNTPSYMVVDQACFSANPLGNTFSPLGWASLMPDDGYIWSMDNSAELEKGWIIKGETLEELAGLINVDTEGLKASVERYNGFCANSLDEDFQRPLEPGFALGEGPYYAIEMRISLLYSICGVLSDEQSRVLDWFDEPIPRLYSAGNIGQGSFLMPICFAGCIARGRYAVRDAATLSPWDGASSEE